MSLRLDEYTCHFVYMTTMKVPLQCSNAQGVESLSPQKFNWSHLRRPGAASKICPAKQQLSVITMWLSGRPPQSALVFGLTIYYSSLVYWHWLRRQHHAGPNEWKW